MADLPNFAAMLSWLRKERVNPAQQAVYVIDALVTKASMPPEARCLLMAASDHLKRAISGSTVDKIRGIHHWEDRL